MDGHTLLQSYSNSNVCYNMPTRSLTLSIQQCLPIIPPSGGKLAEPKYFTSQTSAVPIYMVPAQRFHEICIDTSDQRNADHVNMHDMLESPTDPYDTTTGEQRFCGGYGEWGHVINHTERTILPDLKQYPFTDDIKNTADVIYNKMRHQVRRGKIRFQMLFFCTYCSHLELGRDVNPIQLGALFGLTPGEVQRCDSLFSPLQTGYRPPNRNASPLGYLPEYCQGMDLSHEAIEEIMKMSATILRKDPTLYQENPQTVAAGLLRYYTITNGISNDDPQKITRITGRSTVTIDGMFKRISTIDNS